jgi:Bacterial archaeo-eukaryotic release factor family 10
VINRADADRLRAVRATDPAVVSVYLQVPVDLAEHRALPVRARDLIKSAASQEPRAGGGMVRETDPEAIITAVTQDSHEWLGRTIALFACAQIEMFEAVPLPGYLTERAVIADRPYIRPMLAAIQRNPAYRAALLDTKHAWVLNIADDQIETVAERTDPGVRSPQFGGWYGLEAYRIQQRIIKLSKQHFRDTISILERSEAANTPLVLGGHENEISHFLAALPRTVRQTVAGSFSVDLQTATPGRVRELARPVIARWSERTEARLVDEVLNEPPNLSVTTDLDGCLAASRARAVAQLFLPDDQIVPGFACDDCGVLSSTAEDCDCPDPAESCHAVPDLLDELATRTLDGGGLVTAVRNPPFTAAARLRFPVPAAP